MAGYHIEFCNGVHCTVRRHPRPASLGPKPADAITPADKWLSRAFFFDARPDSANLATAVSSGPSSLHRLHHNPSAIEY